VPQIYNKFEYNFKIIINDDSGEGKTSLIERT
jgi:hypothetical protein